jgi:voltage-gated potassium channel Kch
MRYFSRWPLTLLLALVTILLSVAGYYGMQTPAHRPDLIDWLVSTMDLFKMSWNWPDKLAPIPWPLQVARLTGAFFTLSALGKVWMKFFGEQMTQLRLASWRGHVVVCGLGRKGFDLARTFRRQGDRVVVTDPNPDEDDIAVCRAEGILLESGDATRSYTLAKVGVERARYVLAVCRDDHTNLEVAMETLARYRESGSDRPLICYAHLVNLTLRVLLQRQELLQTHPPGFDLRFFNIYENTARALLAGNPLEEAGDGQRVHLVVVGITRLSEAVVTQAARIGHYADLREIRVTVVDEHAEIRGERFLARQPGIHESCEIRFVDLRLSQSQFTRLEFLDPATSSSERLTVVFCLEADVDNVALALTVSEQSEVPCELLASVSERKGLAKLVSASQAELGATRIHSFGSIEDVCGWDLLREEKLDVLARVFAEHYRAEYGGPMWSELTEDSRNSNRAAADHIDVKLRAIGCERAEAAEDGVPAFTFTESELELLSRMEHRRWCADHWLRGWRLGPRDNGRKRHPNLVSWEDLGEPDREKDRAQVRAIPTVLAAAGFSIHRVAK